MQNTESIKNEKLYATRILYPNEKKKKYPTNDNNIIRRIKCRS